MKKKSLAILLFLIAFLGLLAAIVLVYKMRLPEKPEKDYESNNETEQPAPPVTEAEQISLTFTKDTWPVVDGATAFLPFYQEMTARMLNISTDEAVDYVMCSTTDYAYPYLWQKKVDLVFCLRPSEAQVQEAEREGVVFEEVPFANEGFVFFVNKDNPVDSITVQQLHDIYAGKITNWKELGGNDEEIIAYQRTEGSGSQTGLYLHVIGPDEIQEPPLEERIGTMGEIIDAVAGYKNAAGAIGYSYRYFVTNMHYDEQIKLLKVEGVYPDYASIANGTYPLISDVCAVYREDAPADSAVRKIAAWCSSSQGAILAKELGYVPTAEAVGTLYKPDQHRPDAVHIDYAKGNPCAQCTKSSYRENNLEIQETEIEDVGSYIQISGLKNKTVQETINKRIYDAFMELSEVDIPPYPGAKTRLALLNNSNEEISESIYANVQGNFNNIFSVTLNKNIWTSSEPMSIGEIRTLNFDLRTGKDIFIGDMFVDSMDGVAYINEKILEESAKPEAFDEPSANYWGERSADIYFRRAFEGINPNQKYYINHYDGSLHIILDYENPEIANLCSYTDYTIDMREIHAYESRFMDEENLFEDETKRLSLFRRDGITRHKTIDQWSDGRDISFYAMFSYYDDRTQRLAEQYTFSDERLAQMKAEIESQYDTYAQAGFSELEGYVNISTNVYSYGAYTNVDILMNYEMSYANPGDEYPTITYTTENESYCFDAHSDTPIKLKEIFQPGCDSDSLLEETALRNLKQSIGDKYSEDTYRAIFREVLENLDGFSIWNDSLDLLCLDIDNILSKYSITVDDEDYENCEDAYTIKSSILTMTYADLGVENLILFDSAQ